MRRCCLVHTHTYIRVCHMIPNGRRLLASRCITCPLCGQLWGSEDFLRYIFQRLDRNASATVYASCTSLDVSSVCGERLWGCADTHEQLYQSGQRNVCRRLDTLHVCRRVDVRGDLQTFLGASIDVWTTERLARLGYTSARRFLQTFFRCG
jgi:hypothetical protein